MATTPRKTNARRTTKSRATSKSGTSSAAGSGTGKPYVAGTTAASSAAKAETNAAGTGEADVVVSQTDPVVAGPTLRKKELIEAAVEKTGRKKKDVKPIVEAVLAVMGTALGDGRDLNLQPMGNLRVRKSRPLRSGRVLTTKIRQGKREKLPEPTE